eukprot:785333-Rhodomonas_salina.1
MPQRRTLSRSCTLPPLFKLRLLWNHGNLELAGDRMTGLKSRSSRLLQCVPDMHWQVLGLEQVDTGQGSNFCQLKIDYKLEGERGVLQRGRDAGKDSGPTSSLRLNDVQPECGRGWVGGSSDRCPASLGRVQGREKTGSLPLSQSRSCWGGEWEVWMPREEAHSDWSEDRWAGC